MRRDTLERLNTDRAEKRPVALVTEIASGVQQLVYSNAVSPGAELPQDILNEARSALADDRSATCDVDGKSYFIQVHNPPLRLYIVGAVHITQALAQMASIAGYTVTVIDHAIEANGAEGLTGEMVREALFAKPITTEETHGFLPTLSFTPEAPFPLEGLKVNVGTVKDGKITIAATGVDVPQVEKW